MRSDLEATSFRLSGQCGPGDTAAGQQHVLWGRSYGMGSNLSFKDICNSAAAIRCRKAGQTNAQIAKSAGKTPGTVGRWVNKAGFKPRAGKLRHVSEAAALVDKLLEMTPAETWYPINHPLNKPPGQECRKCGSPRVSLPAYNGDYFDCLDCGHSWPVAAGQQRFIRVCGWKPHALARLDKFWF